MMQKDEAKTEEFHRLLKERKPEALLEFLVVLDDCGFGIGNGSPLSNQIEFWFALAEMADEIDETTVFIGLNDIVYTGC